jgi:hypothetical protein
MTTDNKDTARWSNKENFVSSPRGSEDALTWDHCRWGNSIHQLKALGSLGRDASQGLIVGNSPMSPPSLAVYTRRWLLKTPKV